jgi:hypothetical protein
VAGIAAGGGSRGRPGRAADPDRVRALLDKDQELDSQIIALRAAGCTRIFSEKISTRVKVRPELDAALGLCRESSRSRPPRRSSSSCTSSSGPPATPLN